MSLVLKKIGRAELLDQIRKCVDMSRTPSGKVPECELVVMSRNGKRRIVKVSEDALGVFMWPYEENSPFIAMAPFMGSNVHYHTLHEIVAALERCKSDDVWLDAPREDPHTVPGKVLGIEARGTLTVILVPVPADIEVVNREVHAYVSHRCELASGGQECGDCPFIGGCEHLKAADEWITGKRGSGKETP